MLVFTIAAFCVCPVLADPIVFYPEEHHWDFENDYKVASAWAGSGGQAAGILDSTRNHAPRDTTSMRCEQVPTQTRPRVALNTNTFFGLEFKPGSLQLYVYDDGASVKSFDVRVDGSDAVDGTGQALYVALGLRDTDESIQTNYTYNFNGTVGDTGVARSVGWHLFEFDVYGTGARLRINGNNFPGNTYSTMTSMGYVSVRTDLGDPGDLNQVWIDDVFYSAVSTPMPAVVPGGGVSDFTLGATGAKISIDVTNDPDGGTINCELVHVAPGGNISTLANTASCYNGTITVDRISNDRYWQITQTGLTNVTYQVMLEGAGADGISGMGGMVIMKRANASFPWEAIDSSTVCGTTGIGADGDMLYSTTPITSLSDFTFGSDASNANLPVSISGFMIE